MKKKLMSRHVLLTPFHIVAAKFVAVDLLVVSVVTNYYIFYTISKVTFKTKNPVYLICNVYINRRYRSKLFIAMLLGLGLFSLGDSKRWKGLCV